MDLSTSWKRAQISEIAEFQPPVYWLSVAVGLLTHWLQAHVFFSLKGKYLSLSTRMQTDCRTAPHQVKPCLPGSPGLLLCLKADFVSEFSLCLCFAQRWVSAGRGLPETLAWQQDMGVMCWCKGLAHKHQSDNRCGSVSLLTCVNGVISQHNRISPMSFSIYWFTWWNTRQGYALLTGERTESKARAEGAALGCWVSSCCVLQALLPPAWVTWVSGSMLALSPTKSVGFIAVSYLCSLG